jgi:hypothetical protein
MHDEKLLKKELFFGALNFLEYKCHAAITVIL